MKQLVRVMLLLFDCSSADIYIKQLVKVMLLLFDCSSADILNSWSRRCCCFSTISYRWWLMLMTDADDCCLGALAWSVKLKELVQEVLRTYNCAEKQRRICPLGAGASATVTAVPVKLCVTRTWRTSWCASASTTLQGLTVRSVCLSTMTGRGPAPPSVTPTSVSVSETCHHLCGHWTVHAW